MKPFPYRKVIIVIAVSVINGLNAITRISSLFFVASIDRYNVDREKASFPYALRLVIEPLAGPFIGFLACKLGFRPVVVLGGLITSISFAACFFAEDILMLSIIYGGIFAIGIAMARELLPVVINVHFHKDLALINGLALLGSSIGGLLLPLLFDVTLDMYGLSGTFLVIGGILLHSVPAGMLLWPPKSAENKIEAQNSKKTNNDITLDKCSPKLAPAISWCPVGDKNVDENVPMHSILTNQLNTESASFSPETAFKNKCSQNSENFFITQQDNSKLNCENDKKIFDDNPVVDLECNRDRRNKQSSFEPPVTFEKSSQKIKCSTHDKPNEYSMQTKEERKEIKSNKGAPKCLNNNKKNYILEILSLFWDTIFILIATSQSLFRLAYTLFIMIFVDYARDNNIPRNQAIYLVMCLSASDIIGRLSLGWITDRSYMGIENFTALSYVVAAASLVVICFWTEFPVMFSAIFVFCLAAAGLSIVLPGMVTKYFKGNKKTTAMASRFFLFGPMSLTISPLIGVFRTGQGSYIGLMYLIVASLLLCAVSQLLLPIIERRRSNNKRTEEQSACIDQPKD